MQSLITFLEGKKTYGFCVLLVLTAIGQYTGHVDVGTALELYGVFGAGGLASHRSAISKMQADLTALQSVLSTIQTAATPISTTVPPASTNS